MYIHIYIYIYIYIKFRVRSRADRGCGHGFQEVDKRFCNRVSVSRLRV